jgi:septum site-determining protein MinC
MTITSKEMPFSTRQNPAFELKGSLFTLTVLHLFSASINVFTAQLRYHAQKMPNLFKNMPLVIDLQRLEGGADDIDFTLIQHHLREYGLIPVGVRHGNEKQNNAAQNAGLAILTNQPAKAKPKTSTEKTAPQTLPHTQVVTKPVRSGQQIYARQGNLVVLAPVSHGAELLADGHIHVYSSLRGRALAGITGDKTARIFCPKLEAELVSIAGYYLLSENLPMIKAPMVQVYLENDKICAEGLSGQE